jgi:hypothetical protein
MKYLKSTFIAACFVLCFWLTCTQDAYTHAYLDPGLGSFVYQILLSSLLGALFAIKIYWRRIRSLFAGLSARIKRKVDE